MVGPSVRPRPKPRSAQVAHQNPNLADLDPSIIEAKIDQQMAKKSSHLQAPQKDVNRSSN